MDTSCATETDMKNLTKLFLEHYAITTGKNLKIIRCIPGPFYVLDNTLSLSERELLADEINIEYFFWYKNRAKEILIRLQCTRYLQEYLEFGCIDCELMDVCLANRMENEKYKDSEVKENTLSNFFDGHTSNWAQFYDSPLHDYYIVCFEDEQGDFSCDVVSRNEVLRDITWRYRLNHLIPVKKYLRQQLIKWQDELWKPDGYFCRKGYEMACINMRARGQEM